MGDTHNPEIAKAIADFLDDPNDHTAAQLSLACQKHDCTWSVLEQGRVILDVLITRNNKANR